ncbi:unnamed protein product [Orchesella dallaii]|uniref:UBC core domain-containing protein n=1 Tax=Orchesella dallaii TaxID=48710 RepID=A0ABP1QHD7_9HEXA
MTSSQARDAMKRLQADLKRLQKDPPAGISADSDDDNIYKWNATIFGPGDTPFEDGCFRLRLEFPLNYPQKCPTVWFYSRMFHPNVYQNGKICLDILEEESKWDSAFDAAGVLCAIQAMLGDPNPESPANSEANILFLEHPAAYEKRVRRIVEMSMEDQASNTKNLNAEDQQDGIERNMAQLDLTQFQVVRY